MRFLDVRIILFLLIISARSVCGQVYSEEKLIGRLQAGSPIPDKILSTRTVVLYSPNISVKEIQTIHDGMIRTGIDAIAYFTTDYVASGFDVAQGFSSYFKKREVVNLIFIIKKEIFTIFIAPFNGKDDFLQPNQAAWSSSNAKLGELLNDVYRTALIGNTKSNFLINDFPEKNLSVNIIAGQRNETFTYDLKVDNLAVPKFGDEAMDKELGEIMKSYPFKYQLTEPGTPEEDLRKKGFLYILRFVHARGEATKDLLGFELKAGEGAFVSATYPAAKMEMKTIPSDKDVFKFYARHIDNKNVFLGPKWDADTTWQQALKNFIYGLRYEFRID